MPDRIHIKQLDCTLRDGGYYTNWDFPKDLVVSYLNAMASARIDYVELGFRSLQNAGFKGAYAYTTDKHIETLSVPPQVRLGVMVNAAELLSHGAGLEDAIERLFLPRDQSRVELVRIAAHVHELKDALTASGLLKNLGYKVGVNLMQIADRSDDEIRELGKDASNYQIDILYFADSLGSLKPSEVPRIVGLLRECWEGEIGIHAHDNIGCGVLNSIAARDGGATWIDGTVCGMGRGAGNAQTEYLVAEISDLARDKIDFTSLLTVIAQYFEPLKARYKWGSNPYYYLAGKYGIHPTYIQQMLSDPRYDEATILSVIEYLRDTDSGKFSLQQMETGRQLYSSEPTGTWVAKDVLNGRSVLLLGAGPSIEAHSDAIEAFIKEHEPVVVALNTRSGISANLINFRAACQPLRLIADCNEYERLGHPLIMPFAQVPEAVKSALVNVEILDFGVSVGEGRFEFFDSHCHIPAALVMAYALAVVTSGGARHAYLAGFDGYGADDKRTHEVEALLEQYTSHGNSVALQSITPSRYSIDVSSAYGPVEEKA